MIWRDDQERAKACNAILRNFYIVDLFDETLGEVSEVGLRLRPPTHRDFSTVNEFGALSPSAQTTIRFAWDVWNGEGRTCLAEMLDVLDGRNRTVVGRFFLAWASDDHALMADFIANPNGDARPALPRRPMRKGLHVVKKERK